MTGVDTVSSGGTGARVGSAYVKAFESDFLMVL
jgi:hypothetical protein